MHTLVELLVELKALAAAPSAETIERINALFANPRAPAEFQVGRYYVARLLLPLVEEQVHDVDPRVRAAAIATARHTFPRSAAARVLRRVVKDPDMKVRRAAREATRALRLDDVAPPDTRLDGGRHQPSGWGFGTFGGFGVLPGAGRRRPALPSRPAALAAHQLPPLESRADIAQLVGVPEDELAALMRPGTGPGAGYVEFEIPKAKGGTRRIAAPRGKLRAVQRVLLDKILDRVPLHDACHGFAAGRSTLTNARPHERAAIVVKLDLKDFFPTVHYRRVQGLFAHLGYSAEVAAVLAGLTTHRPKLANGDVAWPGLLPQGAPTSPALANLACRRLDRRLERLAAKYGAAYTRYADDLTFSFATEPAVKLGRFLWWVDGICQQEGFTERADKRRVLRAKHQQRVTGLVVNARAHIPRAERRRFRAILHNCAKHGIAAQARDWSEAMGGGDPAGSARGAGVLPRGINDFAAYLAGYAAYVHMIDPVLGRSYLDEVARLLEAAHA